MDLRYPVVDMFGIKYETKEELYIFEHRAKVVARYFGTQRVVCSNMTVHDMDKKVTFDYIRRRLTFTDAVDVAFAVELHTLAFGGTKHDVTLATSIMEQNTVNGTPFPPDHVIPLDHRLFKTVHRRDGKTQSP